ncbi:MAG: DNA mismatch repair endonuclease MutL [Endomicrobium sp.]|nr:DNA mismatch repair endonuclease MutL [Endomicrobium sp.]
MSINILPQDTINKIAAGEIIECPSNVIKELIENSLDAFASSITVEIDESGKKLMRISDNGVGMDKRDLKLSILRHATSKIKSFSDLLCINSLGFRGEALSSIVATSKFVMKSKKKDEYIGWKLISEDNNVEILPWLGSEGTIIEVKDLFFNIPARKRFLKSNITERLKITKCIKKIALANNSVSFKMLSESKTVFSIHKSINKINRIIDILGKSFTKTIQNINIHHSSISLDIFFHSKNSCFLLDRRHWYLFVNSRHVDFPKWLSSCIYQVYKESIDNKKYPGILIYIKIDPSKVNVNVHPTKKVVKFVNESEIYNIIYKTLKDVFIDNNYKNPYTKILNNLKITTTENSFINNSIQETLIFNKHFKNNIKIIGQVFDTYIIAEIESHLYIFDQHTVSERIKYETYNMKMKNKLFEVQQMLIPESFDLTSRDSEFLRIHIGIFNELGINIEEFVENSFRITAYPAFLGNIEIKQIVKTVIDDIRSCNNSIIDIKQKEKRIIQIACRTSVKAGDIISLIEAKKLINDLFKCEYPLVCPHGRPTMYKFSQRTLEQYFNRK